MKLDGLTNDLRLRVAALVFACFLLGSTGWLAWLYRISELADPTMVDLYTMVLGYLSQAVGIGIFMLVMCKLGERAILGTVLTALVAYLILLDPATLSNSLSSTLAFGWLMNICCGISQGFYLTCLAGCVARNYRGIVFGGAYAASTLVSWLLANVAGGILTTGTASLAVDAVLAALSVGLVLSIPRGIFQLRSSRSVQNDTENPDQEPAQASEANRDAKAAQNESGDKSTRSLLVLAGITVVLVSLVNNMGFSFPTVDLSSGVDLELSRLFYGVGLVIAGIIADRDRRYVMAFCAGSLVVPFLMLALTGAGATGIVLWVIGYLLFGFFAVFRITLFADLAADNGRLWLAGAGLLFGRIGDALGTVLFLLLGSDTITLIMVTAVLFGLAIWLLLRLYRNLYLQTEAPAPERDLLGEFCVKYDLSAREREVLPLLVEGKTNAEIAAKLFITEHTVKYHVRNIRQKTNCETRLDVANLFISESNK